MNDALYIAATGMQAHQSQLEVIANNVANVGTPSFKRGRVNFNDLMQIDPTDPSRAVSAIVNGGGSGVTVGSISKQFSMGELRQNDDPMSVAIQGDGFLEVLLPDGSNAYIRSSKLQVNADHMLATSDGLVLKQKIQIGQDVRQFSIGSDGVVTGTDDKARSWNLGRIELAMFSNTAGLTAMGDNLYRASPAAGEPLVATPGEAGSGRLLQGFEEASNVKLIDEMVQLMVAQRAYEMNVKVIQAADELAGMANNLRK